ncbi:MAG: hypothetical protein ABW133_01330 [Polyangiaceae bacterium]
MKRMVVISFVAVVFVAEFRREQRGGLGRPALALCSSDDRADVGSTWTITFEDDGADDGNLRVFGARQGAACVL